jgi:osomolarity two-component system sensor histidine kinase NIK1
VSGNWAGDTGMSAEKELELLKAQVQDIARVCKVSNQGGKWQRFTLRLTL